MIPTITVDPMAAYAGFAWAAGGFVIAALGGILVALVRDGRVKSEADAERAVTPDDLRSAA